MAKTISVFRGMIWQNRRSKLKLYCSNISFEFQATENILYRHFVMFILAMILEKSKREIKNVSNEIFRVLKKLDCGNGRNFLPQFLCDSHPNGHHPSRWTSDSDFHNGFLDCHKLKRSTCGPNKVWPYFLKHLIWFACKRNQLTNF